MVLNFNKKAMVYKAIGFDYGGVIDGPPGFMFMHSMAKFLDVSLDILQKVYFENNHRANVEKISWTELWKHVAMELNRSEKQDELIIFIDEWEEKKTVNQDVVNLINKLKSSGYKIGLLSNYSDGLRVRLDQQGITDCFDVIGISSEMGVMKPKEEAFFKFCDMLDVRPFELVFIDDTHKSLETAGSVGYTPILFRDFASLHKELVLLEVI